MFDQDIALQALLPIIEHESILPLSDNHYESISISPAATTLNSHIV